MEQPFLDAFAAAYPKDPTSQAVAKERARARAAGWEAVMGRATSGQRIDREMLNNETEAAFSDASTPVKVTTATRDVDGELVGSLTVDVGSRRLARDRLIGMTDALVSLCDAYVTAGGKAGYKVSAGQ